jgi:hypothetical protein
MYKKHHLNSRCIPNLAIVGRTALLLQNKDILGGSARRERPQPKMHLQLLVPLKRMQDFVLIVLMVR